MSRDIGFVFETFATNAADVLAQITSQPWRVVLDGSEAVDISVVVMFRCEGSWNGNLRVAMAKADAVAAAQLLTGEASAGDAFGEDDREALEELVRQITGAFTASMRQEFGDVRLVHVRDASHAWTEASARTMTLESSGKAIRMRVDVDHALRSWLERPAAEVPSANPDLPGEQPTIGRNLELLMDVQLGVTLRFGQKTMLLRDVLELGAGTVVELDKRVQDPVDLLLDGKLIARGEVVVLDGSYGLRVSEVASAQQSG